MSELRPVPLPEPRSVHLRWRRVVLDLVERFPRGAAPSIVHVGEPAGRCVSEVIAPPRHPAAGPDAALAADLVAALLQRARDVAQPIVWVTRPGDLAPGPTDLAWFAAARTAFAEADRPLTFVVVGRHGWHDVVSGAGHDWGRVPH